MLTFDVVLALRKIGQSIPVCHKLPHGQGSAEKRAKVVILQASLDTCEWSTYPCRPFVRPAPCARRQLRIHVNEAYVPARQSEACTHARFSCPYVDQRRPTRPETSPREGQGHPDTIVSIGRRPGKIPADLERSSSYRFPTHNRLLDARSFARVFDDATRSRDRLFTVLYRNNDLDFARLGLAISKKHCKKAVDRNRIKRIIRESFRHHSADLPGLDVVVLNQPAATDAGNPALVESLERHWRRCTRPGESGKR